MCASWMNLGIVGADGLGPRMIEEINKPSARGAIMRIEALLHAPSNTLTPKEQDARAAGVEEYGVRLVETPAELAESVDGILILPHDPVRHLALIKELAPFGRPLFVGAPLEVTPATAREAAAVARRHDCRMFCASAFRFAPEIMSARRAGGIDSALAHVPCEHLPVTGCLARVHAVEMLYALLGPGCRAVRCLPSENGPIIAATWHDGRLGVARAVSPGEDGYGFALSRAHASEAHAVRHRHILEGLYGRIHDFLAHHEQPVELEESVEVVSFIDAADRSLAALGEPVSLA